MAKRVKAKVVREVIRPVPVRPDLWLVLSPSPHSDSWDVSTPKTSEQAARLLVEHNGMRRAAIVHIPGAQSGYAGARKAMAARQAFCRHCGESRASRYKCDQCDK